MARVASVAVDFEKIGAGLDAALAKEVIFLVGVTRWGAAWVGQTLSAHPEVCDVVEGHFTDDLFPRLADLLADYRGPADESGPATGFAADDIDFVLRSAAGLLFSRASRGGDFKTLIESTPEHILHLDVLGRLFPKARFIHLLRDGRDETAAAWTYNLAHSRGGFQQTYPDLAAFADSFAGNWGRGVGAARRFERKAGERFLEVRVENLVAAPLETAARLFEFIGVVGDADMIRACADTGWDMAPLDIEPAGWRSRLDDESQRAFERQAGELLKLVGYPTIF